MKLWEREDGEMWLETAEDEDGLLKLCVGDGDFFYTDADELRAMVEALPRRDEAQAVRAALEGLVEAVRKSCRACAGRGDEGMKNWSCKIGEVEPSKVPAGGDLPMRKAIQEAYEQLTGEAPAFCFSGWGAQLTDGERAVVEIARKDRALEAALEAIKDGHRRAELIPGPRYLQLDHRLGENPDSCLMCAAYAVWALRDSPAAQPRDGSA